MATDVPPPGGSGYSTTNLLITPSESGGLGLFAARNLQRGEVIIKEDDLVVPAHIIKQQIASLARPMPTDNSVCGPTMARINHSCSQWNAKVNHGTGSRELVAELYITKGDEITVNYETIPKVPCKQPDGSVAERPLSAIGRSQKSLLLRKQFGFQCSCKDCAKENVCSACKKPATNRCTACSFARYCNKKCQAADWASHKLFCLEFRVHKKKIEAIADEYANACT